MADESWITVRAGAAGVPGLAHVDQAVLRMRQRLTGQQPEWLIDITHPALQGIRDVLPVIRDEHGQQFAEVMARVHVKMWEEAEASQRAQAVAYFHGGAPGLKVGDKVLPSSVTGTDNVMSRYVRGTADYNRLLADCLPHVYFTPASDLAADFAAVQPDGTLYQVVPDGAFEPDPDCGVPGLAWRCPSATVVGIAEEQVLLQRDLTPAQIEKRYGDAGSPMYARVLTILRSEGRLIE